MANRRIPLIPNLDALKKLATDAENRKGEFEDQDIRFFKFDDPGHYKFIVMPPYNDRGLYVKQIFTHWNLGENGNSKIVCPEYNPESDDKRPCPVCFVLNQLRNNMDKEDAKALSSWYARGATFVNVKMLEVAGKKVTDMEEFALPMLLRGPSKLADHINYNIFKLMEHRIENGFDFEEYKYTEEIIFDVKKIQKGAKKSNVSYEYNTAPYTAKLAKNSEELDLLLNNIYDIDPIMANQEKWTREEYDSSVALANSLLEHLGYSEIEPDQFVELVPFEELDRRSSDSDEEKKPAKPKKSLGVSSPSKKVSTKEEEEQEEEEQAEEKPKVSPLTTKKKVDEPKKEIKKSVSAGVNITDGEGINRDPDDLNEDGIPKCYGHQDNNSEVCRGCKYLHSCLQERLRMKLKK